MSSAIRKKTTVSFRLDNAHENLLRTLTRRRKTTQVEVVRDALDHYAALNGLKPVRLVFQVRATAPDAKK